MENTNNNEQGLTSIVSNELVQTSIDLGTDYSEMVIDNFIDDGILKEIPFVKTIYAIGKLSLSVRDRFFVKKLFVFLKEFHSGNLHVNKISNFKDKMKQDEKYRNKVTEHLIVYTEAFLEIDKAKIFSRLFLAHINGHYSWEHFLHISKCLNDLHPKAINYLITLSNYDFNVGMTKGDNKVERNYEDEALLMSCGIARQPSPWASGFAISDIGKDLFLHGIKE